MDTNFDFDRTTAGFLTKMLEVTPRGLNHDRMKHLETSGKLRRFMSILADEEMFEEVDGVVRRTHEIKPIEQTIDLSVPCNLPFPGAERVKSSVKDMVARYELRDGDPYLDGHKISLYLSEKQKEGSVVSTELRTELDERDGNVSAKLIDFWVENPEMFPEHFKEDENGNTVYVFCWEDIFRGPSDGRLYVRCASWRGGRVASGCGWLGRGWDSQDPAASFAN